MVTQDFRLNHLVIKDGRFPVRYKRIIDAVEKGRIKGAVKGIIAQSGTVRGVVKIIHRYDDLASVRQGDVLVANTTHPDYLPAMKRAAAFVTDEGGMISHAAIVAREMKKPCIVGTHNATKILHDGDRVEVDAEKGIVEKIYS